MPIIPIIPSINTCMSLTTTTTTSTNAKTNVPEVNTTHLQALAEVCSTVNSSLVNPIGNPVMNSLVSATKVVTNDDILNPITSNLATSLEMPKSIPISCVPVPIMHPKVDEDNTFYVKDKISGDDKHKSGLLNEQNVVTSNVIAKEELGNPIDYPIEEVVNNIITNTAKTITTTTADISNIKEVENNTQTVQTSSEEEKKRLNIVFVDTNNMTDENNSSPFSGNEPMECSSSLASQTSPKEESKLGSDDVVMSETLSVNEFNVS